MNPMSNNADLVDNSSSQNSNTERYKQLVSEEDILFEKLNTYNLIFEAIYRTVFKQANNLHIETVGEILCSILEMEHDVRIELMHQRLAKNVIAWEIDFEQKSLNQT